MDRGGGGLPLNPPSYPHPTETQLTKSSESHEFSSHHSHRHPPHHLDTLEYSTSTTSPHVPSTQFMRSIVNAGGGGLNGASTNVVASDAETSASIAGQQVEDVPAPLESASASTCNSTPSPTLTTVLSDPMRSSEPATTNGSHSLAGRRLLCATDSVATTRIEGTDTLSSTSAASMVSTSTAASAPLISSVPSLTTRIPTESINSQVCGLTHLEMSHSGVMENGHGKSEAHHTSTNMETLNDFASASTAPNANVIPHASLDATVVNMAMMGTAPETTVTPSALMALSRFASKLDVGKRTMLLKILFQMSLDAVQGRPDHTQALLELQRLALTAGGGDTGAEMVSNNYPSYEPSTGELTDSDAKLAMDTLQMLFSQLPHVANMDPTAHMAQHSHQTVSSMELKSEGSSNRMDMGGNMPQNDHMHSMNSMSYVQPQCSNDCRNNASAHNPMDASHHANSTVADSGYATSCAYVEYHNPRPSHPTHNLPVIDIVDLMRNSRPHCVIQALRNQSDMRSEDAMRELQPRSLNFASRGQNLRMSEPSGPVVPPEPYDQAALDNYLYASNLGYSEVHPSAAYMTGITDQMAKALSTKFYETADPIPHSVVFHPAVGANGAPTDRLEASIDIAAVIVANIEVDVDVFTNTVLATYPLPASLDAIHAALSSSFSSGDVPLASLLAYEVPYQDAREYIRRVAEQQRAEVSYRRQRLALRRKLRAEREEHLAQRRLAEDQEAQKQRELEAQQAMMTQSAPSTTIEESSPDQNLFMPHIQVSTQPSVSATHATIAPTQDIQLSIQVQEAPRNHSQFMPSAPSKLHELPPVDTVSATNLDKVHMVNTTSPVLVKAAYTSSTETSDATASPSLPSTSSDDQPKTRKTHSRSGRRSSDSSVEDMLPTQAAASFGSNVSTAAPIPSPTSGLASLRTRKSLSSRRSNGVDSGTLGPMSPVLVPPVLTPNPTVVGYGQSLPTRTTNRHGNSQQGGYEAPLPSPMMRRYPTRQSAQSQASNTTFEATPPSGPTLGLAMSGSSTSSAMPMIPHTPLPSPALPPRAQTSSNSFARRASLNGAGRTPNTSSTALAFPIPSPGSVTEQSFFPAVGGGASSGTLPATSVSSQRRLRQVHSSPMAAPAPVTSNSALRSPSASSKSFMTSSHVEESQQGASPAFTRYKSNSTQVASFNRTMTDQAEELSLAVIPDDISPLIISTSGQIEQPTPLVMGAGHDSPPTIAFNSDTTLKSSALDQDGSTAFTRITSSMGGRKVSLLSESEANLLNAQLSSSTTTSRRGPGTKDDSPITSMSNGSSPARKSPFSLSRTIASSHEDQDTPRLGRKRTQSRLAKNSSGESLQGDHAVVSAGETQVAHDQTGLKRVRH